MDEPVPYQLAQSGDGGWHATLPQLHSMVIRRLSTPGESRLQCIDQHSWLLDGVRPVWVRGEESVPYLTQPLICNHSTADFESFIRAGFSSWNSNGVSVDHRSGLIQESRSFE